MSVNIVCGLTGSGKTYFVLRTVLELLKKLPEDFILATNTPIQLPDDFDREVKFISTPKELLELRRAIVIIDDGGIWFGSRQWDKLDPRIQDMIINNRKDGLRIYVTTQFLEGIDKYIRMNCHQYWEAEKWFGSDEYAPPDKVWGVIRVKRYHPRMHDKIRRKRLETKYFLIRNKYISLYDTYAKVSSRTEWKKLSNTEKPEVKRAHIREQQAYIEKARELEVRRSRGRPKKIKILTG